VRAAASWTGLPAIHAGVELAAHPVPGEQVHVELRPIDQGPSRPDGPILLPELCLDRCISTTVATITPRRTGAAVG